ncbi:MAG: acyl-CoA/acyl-ACP dehydrogenase [Actinobacteria bacterium]|nr:acyl-CoA/acyl-ACP dehydrogenase [Actinomycetota bacterium]
MDFAFTDEQELLRSQARSFLAERRSLEAVAEREGSFEPGSWQELAELGWTGVSVSEEEGGAGLGFLEEAVIFEELGRVLYPGPYFSTIALALPALAGHAALLQRVAAGELTATLAHAEAAGPRRLADTGGLATEARQDGAAWTLAGEKVLVPDLGSAGTVVVTARSGGGVGLWSVEGGAREPVETMDSTRPYGVLRLDGAPASLLVEPGSGEEALAQIRTRALAALALEAVGVGEAANALAIEHASSREQFGRAIGVYQAVSHSVVDGYVGVELARSLAYWAAWCVAEGDEQAAVAAAAAKAHAAEAAVAACERSIQVHGGIGFTWEHVLHRLYKRAQWIQAFEGFAPVLRREVASALLDVSEEESTELVQQETPVQQEVA